MNIWGTFKLSAKFINFHNQSGLKNHLDICTQTDLGKNTLAGSYDQDLSNFNAFSQLIYYLAFP